MLVTFRVNSHYNNVATKISTPRLGKTHDSLMELDIGGKKVPLTVQRHPRARRYTIRYRPLNGDILLTLPKRASLKEGVRFAESRSLWLEVRIKRAGERVALVPEAVIPVLGQSCRLVQIEARRGVVVRIGNEIHIPGDPAFFERRITDWLKAELKREIAQLVVEKAAALNAKARSITLRDTSSRWGSCSAQGDLTFSWRMVFAPYEALDYLVAHEVAHLREMNHSDRFWKLVAQLCPDWQKWRDWLKHEGNQLYNYG